MATASLFRVCFGADITTERVAPAKFSSARRQVWSSKVQKFIATPLGIRHIGTEMGQNRGKDTDKIMQ